MSIEDESGRYKNLSLLESELVSEIALLIASGYLAGNERAQGTEP